jgi:hypothetical protein
MPIPQYFQNITTLPDLERERRRLAKMHHPDVAGGSLTVMQEINAEYERVRKRLESPGAGRAYTPPQPAPKPQPQGSTGRQYSSSEDIWGSYLKNWQARMHEEILRNARRGWWESYTPEPDPPRQQEEPTARQRERAEVDRQEQRLKEELAWALNEIRKAQSQGLLRSCTAYTDRMQTTLKVGGNTYPYREWFKEHGFRWDADKKQWNFHKGPHQNQEESEVDEDDDYSD